MQWKRLKISLIFIFKTLVRRPIVPILLITIPAVFLFVVYWTSTERQIPFRIASVVEEVFLYASGRNISLVFIAIASVGFLSSFLALTLIQKNVSVNRRLIISGYLPAEILLSHFLIMMMMVIVISIYVGLVLLIFFPPSHFLMMIFGLILAGWVYGSYGLAVGSIIRGELEGILFIVLLANIDAGWLQNPMFYAEAQHQAIIRYLPAYYPSQTAIISAFSEYDILHGLTGSLLYGLIFLSLAIVIYYFKMRQTPIFNK